jgi:hypothetical protein
MQSLQSGDRIELFYEDAPATKIRATVGRLLTDRDKGIGRTKLVRRREYPTYDEIAKVLTACCPKRLPHV